ncbi:MAG TPA: carboxypeptidase-like regulatory domain-containing protein [Bryobacteraceae bacterium]
MTGKPALIAILAATALAAQTTVAVSGRITDTLSGLPIEGASVILFSGNLQVLKSTDSGGYYRIDNVPPNAATIRVEAKGFLEPSPAAIQIAADNAVHNFALTPVSSIIGRIRTDDDAPIPGFLSLALYREDYADGVRHWVNSVWDGMAQLEKDGSFKITNLAAGRYILSAGPPPGGTGILALYLLKGKPEGPAEGYVQTYYPGTTDLNAAVPITLPEGENVAADFAIARHHLYRISGELARSAASLQGNVLVSSTDGIITHTYAGTSSNSGTFTVGGLPPGNFILESMSLYARQPDSSMGIQRIVLSLPFIITDHDLEDLHPASVPPAARLSIQGIFKMANGNPLPSNLSVLYAYPKPGLQTDSIPAAPTGEFWLDGTPGDYSIRPVVPWAYAVSEIRYAGGDYLNSLIPFSANAIDQSLTIILTDQPSSVSGSLIDDRQNPIAAKVVLAPDPLPPNFDFHALRVASTNNDGSFSLNSLTPGRYKAAVLTGDDRKRDHDLAILNDKFATADAFEITAGQNLTIAPKP